MAKLLILVCLMLSSTLRSEAYSATFIKPCRWEDSACLVSSTQAVIPVIAGGIPELAIPSWDPLYIKTGKFESGNLVVKYENLKVTGAKNIKILNVERDIKAGTIKIVAEMPLKAVGQYELDGNILFLKLRGKGQCNIRTDKVRFTLTLKVKTENTSEGKRWKITSYDYQYSVIEKEYIDLENLFGGDENSSNLIKQVFDTNWKEIAEEIGYPIVKEMLTPLIHQVNKLLHSVPEKDLEIVD